MHLISYHIISFFEIPSKEKKKIRKSEYRSRYAKCHFKKRKTTIKKEGKGKKKHAVCK